MVLLIGQPINGRDLEQATSPWSPERFASMCDALAWAASGRQGPGLPSFTTRVNAKDGGVDAEWWVQLPDDNCDIPTPIVGPGWNVFQYKKRDSIAQDRRRIISGLKSSLTGAVNDLVRQDKLQRNLNRYIYELGYLISRAGEKDKTFDEEEGVLMFATNMLFVRNLQSLPRMVKPLTMEDPRRYFLSIAENLILGLRPHRE